MGGVVVRTEQYWAMARGNAGGWPHSESHGQSGNGRSLNATILIVEKDVLIRMPVADFLRDRSYRVIEASNAEEAIAVLQAGEPVEVVFADLVMSDDMNGIALARWIRQKHPEIRVILTSGAVVADEMLPGDADAPLLAKPYSYAELAEKIRRLTTI